MVYMKHKRATLTLQYHSNFCLGIVLVLRNYFATELCIHCYFLKYLGFVNSLIRLVGFGIISPKQMDVFFLLLDSLHKYPV